MLCGSCYFGFHTDTNTSNEIFPWEWSSFFLLHCHLQSSVSFVKVIPAEMIDTWNANGCYHDRCKVMKIPLVQISLKYCSYIIVVNFFVRVYQSTHTQKLPTSSWKYAGNLLLKIFSAWYIYIYHMFPLLTCFVC